MPQGTTCSQTRHIGVVALGANQPLAGATLSESIFLAISGISKRIGSICVSSPLYRTPCFPVGAGPDFVNAVIRFETDLSAKRILTELHRIEADFGRVRARRWGARTLDLDLIALDDAVLPDRSVWQQWKDLSPEDQAVLAPEQLILPHPRMQDRAFVLVPMADVYPDWRHPVLGVTVSEMRDALPADALCDVIALD